MSERFACKNKAKYRFGRTRMPISSLLRSFSQPVCTRSLVPQAHTTGILSSSSAFSFLLMLMPVVFVYYSLLTAFLFLAATDADQNGISCCTPFPVSSFASFIPYKYERGSKRRLLPMEKADVHSRNCTGNETGLKDESLFPQEKLQSSSS